LDCADPEALAGFWAAMLDGEVVFRTATSVGVRTDWVWLSTMLVPDYRAPTWPDGDVPKQIHFNLAVSDLPAATQAAIAIGARPAVVQPAPDEFQVLLDPAGHPFCLSTLLPLDDL
jgi:hypothetical protein